VTSSKVVVRVAPELPGKSAGVVLNPGHAFSYRATRVIQLAPLAADGAPTTVTFYELADGSGWVPDHSRADPTTKAVEPVPSSRSVEFPAPATPAAVGPAGTDGGEAKGLSPRDVVNVAATAALLDGPVNTVLEVRFESGGDGFEPSLGLA
jgi:hypothetical protein